MPYWEDTAPRLSPDGAAGRVRRRRRMSGSCAAAGGPPRRLLEAGEPVWIDDATLLVSVERGDTTRLAVVDVADPWPRRLAHAAADHGDEWAPAVSPDRSEVAFVFTPRDDLNRSEIRVASLATGAVRALTGTPRMQDRAAGVVAGRHRARLRLRAVGRLGAARRRPRRRRRAAADTGRRRLRRAGVAPGRRPHPRHARDPQPLRPRRRRRRRRARCASSPPAASGPRRSGRPAAT